MNSTAKILVGSLALALGLTNCKPKAERSDLQSVTGTDENGREAAFALLPIRNALDVRLANGSKDPGAVQAAALVKTRLFAMIECNAVKGLSGEEIVELLEGRAADDDLYLTAERYITTSNKGDLQKVGDAEGDIMRIPCKLRGDRLLSWDVVADVQTRALGLPDQQPAATKLAAAKRIYLVNQALILAIRGSYAAKDPSMSEGKLAAMVEMAAQQRGEATSNENISHRVLQSDAVYNPCVKGKSGYMSTWKTSNFGCVPMKGQPSRSNYRAGGASAERYVEVRDILALEISRTHDVLQRSNGGDLELARLWNVVTSTHPFKNISGASRDIAFYLAGGSGINFETLFASANAQYKFGTAILPQDVESQPASITSPLAPLLNAKVSDLRVRPLYRASAK